MMITQKFAHICLLVGLVLTSAHASARSSLLILDFELVNEMHDPRTAEGDQQRLRLVSDELKLRMASCPAFRLSGSEPAEANIALARSRVAYVYRCNGCAREIGEAADVQLVLLPWVQKVSNLILNLNAEIRSVATDGVVAARSVDIRGNTDQGWLRGVKVLAGRVCDLDGERLSHEPEN